jgi:beta-phosphoglucomutase
MAKHAEHAVIWDMDGTLVDTAELHFQAWVKLAREIDKPFTRADFAATFGWRNPEIMPKLFGITGDEANRLADHKEALYREEAMKGVELLPGARSLLGAIHAAGFGQAVGSSAPRDNLDLILRLTGTINMFDTVVSMEDTQRGKPDPEVFLKAASRVGAAPARCLVFEDAPAGVQAARAGGMKCIAVRFVGHHAEQSLLDSGANRVVRSLEEVSLQTVRELLA